MMAEKIGKYYDVISGYAFKSTDLKDFADIPIVKIGNISNGRSIIFENMQYVDRLLLKINQKYHIKKGDVLLSLTGSHINQPNSMVGRSCRSYENEIFLLNQRAGKIMPKDEASLDYIYYVLQTKAMKESIVCRAYGAANQVNVSPTAIMGIKWNFPSFPVQRRIASILSAYDNLIENNTRRIRLLEQMAENLYKEWFVRFRFPGHENAEFENGLPKGWNYQRLDSIASINMGQSPSSSFYNEEQKGLPFHQGVGSYGDIYLKDEIYSTQGAKVAEPNSIIFSVRAPVGRINITLNRIYLGRGVAAINSINGNNGFLYWSLRSRFAKEDTIGNGAIFSSVTRDELGRQKMLVPIKRIVVKFESIANKIENLIRDITNQNNSLSRQRDLLLPRLMSGKLEVNV